MRGAAQHIERDTGDADGRDCVMVHSAIVTVRRLAIMPAEASLASSFIEGDEIVGDGSTRVNRI